MKEIISKGIFMRIVRFYVEGFREMTLGKTLWTIILIKLFIMFFVLKLFFFPNVLNSRYDTDQEKAEHVAGEITQSVDYTEPK